MVAQEVQGCPGGARLPSPQTQFCCSKLNFQLPIFPVGACPPPLSACPPETFRLTHSALKLKFLALVDTWRTRTWPVRPKGQPSLLIDFNVLLGQATASGHQHPRPAPRALPAPKELLDGSWRNRSGTFSSVSALHRLTGRQHTDLSSTLLRLQSNRCRSQTERRAQEDQPSSHRQTRHAPLPHVHVSTGTVTSSGAVCRL